MTCRARGCSSEDIYAKGLCRPHYSKAQYLGLIGPCERCERQLGALSTSIHRPHDDATWFATLTPAELAAWSKGYLDAMEHRFNPEPIDALLTSMLR